MSETGLSADRRRPVSTSVRETALADYAMFKAEASERLKYQIDFVQAILRNLILVNGGAIVALFTFIGNAQGNVDATDIWWSFLAFSIGSILVLSAYFGAFFSQKYFMESALYQAWNAQKALTGLDQSYDIMPSFRKGGRAFVIGVILASAELIAFVVGAFFALSGVL